MKKSLTTLFLLSFVLGDCFASQSLKNFFKDYSGQHFTKEQVVQFCLNNYDLPEGSEFRLVREVTDELSMSHYTYQQYVNGIIAEGCYILIHEYNGYVKSINGRVLEKIDTPLASNNRVPKKVIARNRPDIDISKIETVLFEHKGEVLTAYKYYDESKYANVYIDIESGEVIAEISIVSNADKNGTAYTVYNGVKNIVYNSENGVNTLLDNSRNIYTVDATSFDGVNEGSINDFTNPGSEWYVPLLTSVTITWISDSWWYNALTDSKPDLYIKVKRNGVVLYESGYFSDKTPPVTFNIPIDIEADGNLRIEVWDYDGVSDDDGGSTNISKTTAGTYSWNNSKSQATYTISKGSHPALDVHWGMEKVYDFYSAKFNHQSFDGNGSQLIQLVNPPSSISPFKEMNFPYQACAIGNTGIMAYGLGDNEYYGPFVALDVMGHEFTHMVTAANGVQNLPNYGEGGALNESFGDIIGNAIEADALGSTDWLVAAGVNLTTSNRALRSMYAPKSMGHPNTYLGTNWQTVTGNPSGGENGNDMDGVHTNCGVQNYWFYLLSEGGSGHIDDNNSKASYNVIGIGIDKAVRIAYRNLMYYITSTAGYYESREGAIQAAIDLYGQNSQEHQSVVNAWHAVGIGRKYTPSQAPITVKTKMPSNWGTTISAWVWADGSDGNWTTLDKDGEWYSYTSTINPLNIVFVNGTTWNGDNNQSVDICLTESSCIQLGSNTGKRTYTIVECPAEPERYIVVAQRNASSNWFYMTSDLGTGSNKRYQAVDAGTNSLANVSSSDLADKYYWEIEGNKLKTSAGYSTWSSGNTAILDNTGKDLIIQQQTDGTYTFSFADGDNTRYLALNKTTGNDYFAYYSGTNQIYKLTLIKEGESGTTTDIEIIPQQEQQTVTKILQNGQIYILRGDKTYTITGAEVK